MTTLLVETSDTNGDGKTYRHTFATAEALNRCLRDKYKMDDAERLDLWSSGKLRHGQTVFFLIQETK